MSIGASYKKSVSIRHGCDAMRRGGQRTCSDCAAILACPRSALANRDSLSSPKGQERLSHGYRPTSVGGPFLERDPAFDLLRASLPAGPATIPA